MTRPSQQYACFETALALIWNLKVTVILYISLDRSFKVIIHTKIEILSFTENY